MRSIAGVLLVVLGTSIVRAQSTRASDSLPRVTVIGNDYAFIQLPDSIRAGRTLFAFQNRGAVRHEMSIVRLRPGVTVQQVLQQGQGASSRAISDQIVGILIARPGDAPGGELLVDLQPGRRYLVICSLRDMPDAAQHSALGMIKSFEVP